MKKKVMPGICVFLFAASGFAQINYDTRNDPNYLASFENRPGESFLRLIFFPSYPTQIDWTNPRTLLNSSLSSTVSNTNHAISHVNVQIHCSGDTVSSFSGAVSQDKLHSARLLLSDLIGFSILERAWPGRLEPLVEIEDALKKRVENKEPLSSATFLVSDQTCQRLKNYNNTQIDSPFPRYYGFSARPRFLEGGGCSAFAASYVEVAGILSKSLKQNWLRRALVPLVLMGGYLVDKISINEVRRSPASARWALDSEPHMDLLVYDPDMMHFWAENLFQHSNLTDKTTRETFAAMPQTHGIVFDQRSTPTPTENVIQHEPYLERKSELTFVRKDKVFKSGGSFQLTP